MKKFILTLCFSFVAFKVAFAGRVNISSECMKILKDEAYQKKYAEITKQHKDVIEKIYKEINIEPYLTDIEDPNEKEEMAEAWFQEDIKEGKEIGPEYYAIHCIREHNKKITKDDVWNICKDFFCCGGGYDEILPKDISDEKGEKKPFWALYQAGLRFLYDEEGLGMFFLKHLLVLSNGESPISLWGDDCNESCRRIRIVFQRLGQKYYNLWNATHDKHFETNGDLLFEEEKNVIKS